MRIKNLIYVLALLLIACTADNDSAENAPKTTATLAAKNAAQQAVLLPAHSATLLQEMLDNNNLPQLDTAFLYLDFWASWCKPCIESFPFMDSLQHKYAAHNLHVLAVNMDFKREDATRFLAAQQVKFAVDYDQKAYLAESLGVLSLPSSLLIYRGKIVAAYRGFNQQKAQQIEQDIASVLKLAPKTATTNNN